MGNAYQSLGQYQQAIDYHQQSLAIVREIGDRFGEAASLFNLGNALVKLGKTQQAISSYETAKAIFEEIGQPFNADKCETALRSLNNLSSG